MMLLAFDSAAGACSAALWEDGKILAQRYLVMARGQSEALVPMIEDVMDEAGLDFKSLDRLGVTLGPGSFTGVRIALAAAKGISLAAAIPLTGVSTLEAIGFAAAAGQKDAGVDQVLVALSAGREDLYVQAFSFNIGENNAPPLGSLILSPLGPVAALEAEEVLCGLEEVMDMKAPFLVAGNAQSRLREVFPPSTGAVFVQGEGLPHAMAVAEVAARKVSQNSPDHSDPIYVHAHYAKIPGQGK